MTEENMAVVEKLFREDPSLSYDAIEEALKISSPSVAAILHDHLLLKKV